MRFCLCKWNSGTDYRFHKTRFRNSKKKMESIINIFFFFIKISNNPTFSPTSPFLEKIFDPHPYCQIRGTWGGWNCDICSHRKKSAPDLIWKFAKILWWQNVFLYFWQNKPLWVELKINGVAIFITILLHFCYCISLETAQHPEKWSVSFKNFFKKCECIRCYLPISSNLQFQF